MKSAGKARSNGLYRHIRTSKEIIRNLLNYYGQLMKFTRFQTNRRQYGISKYGIVFMLIFAISCIQSHRHRCAEIECLTIMHLV